MPVEYWVEPGREEEGRRSFGRTPDMIEFFSKQLDCPYPYEKYSQVAVRHFHFGGMENASATTQTDGTLHDERAAIDFTTDELVAHELAHMWFGDLITCKSWTHAWLNEGFATYFEALWKEWDLGRDEFDYEMVLNADSYMAEPYRRAISTARYGHPYEMFDMHLYPKAGWVLHMLRRRLGDDLFWKAVRLYVKRCAPGTAETIDLVRSFEDATGKSLGGYFDQWIFSPGHPAFEGELSWDDKAHWVKLSVKQTQKTDDGTPVFRVPVRLEARMPDGSLQTRDFEMSRAEETFFFPLPARAEVGPLRSRGSGPARNQDQDADRLGRGGSAGEDTRRAGLSPGRSRAAALRRGGHQGGGDTGPRAARGPVLGRANGGGRGARKACARRVLWMGYSPASTWRTRRRAGRS